MPGKRRIGELAVMIAGHLGIAYGARAFDRRDPRSAAPLFWLLAAAYAPDLLDGVYARVQFCNPDGTFSHSLPAVAILATVFGVAAFLHTRSARTALIVACVTCLHLPPDYITGRKSLWPGGPVAGLYFYRWPWLDFIIELPVVVGGWMLLRRARYTPSIMVSGLALAGLLTVQAAFDVSMIVRGPQPQRVCAR